MKEITATMKFVVDDYAVEDLKKALSHHADWLIDFESWKGIKDYSTLTLTSHDIDETARPIARQGLDVTVTLNEDDSINVDVTNGTQSRSKNFYSPAQDQNDLAITVGREVVSYADIMRDQILTNKQTKRR